MKIDEMELSLTERGTYGVYRNTMDAVPNSSPIKYMLAISETAREQGIGNDLIFIGGLGILGNLVGQYGVESIPLMREMHDVDAMLNRADCCGGIASVFETQTTQRSNSIRNKYTIKGSGRDFSGETHRAEVDLYVPARPEAYADYFGRHKTHDIFGVPVNVLHPLDALRRKLSVSCMNGHEPREQDRFDIYNLLAVLEKEGYKAKDLRLEVFPGESSDRAGTRLLSKIMEDLKKKDFPQIGTVSSGFMRSLRK